MSGATPQDVERRPPGRWRAGAARVAVGAAYVLFVAFLIAPSEGFSVRKYDGDDEDTVARAPVVASHDFTWERSDASDIAAARESAAAAVLPVWDYDADMAALTEERIRAAFAEARDLLAARGRHLVGPAPEEGSTSAADPPPAGSEDDIARVPKSERLDVVSASAALQQLIASARVSDEVAVDALARDGFSRETEDALLNLVREVLAKHLVEERAAIEAIGAQGVTLRIMRRGAPTHERVVRQLLNFGDMSQLDSLMAPAQHHLFYIQDARLRSAIPETAIALVAPNTRANPEETSRRTESAAAAAEERYRRDATQAFRKGEVLVSRGQVIDRDALDLIARMQATRPELASPLQRVLSAAAIVTLVLLPLVVFARRNLPRFSSRTKDVAMMAVVLAVHLGFTRAGLYVADAIAEQTGLQVVAIYALAPLAAGAMVVRILTTSSNALVYALVYAALAGVVFRFDVAFTLMALLVGIAGSALVQTAQSRTDILRGGLGTGALALGIALATSVLQGVTAVEDSLLFAAGAAASGLSTALFVFALLPFIESTFRYTTPMKLMELANLNHPALKELILKAPGSYHHSMMVGQLVEAACEAVGADALLGRVGSYFHDIGKTRNPGYFAENQQGVNPHDRLRPHMSALVIKAHVKDGVELARQYGLPPEMIAFVTEHHGTSLIAYFHRRAIEQADGAEVSELEFRYPGPKPQTRETAICMLADGIEAASRALADQSHPHLKGLVQRMINRAFMDGQLDECDLTLRDLDKIADAMLRRLTAFYHHRPEYPDGKRATPPRRAKRSDGTGPSAAVGEGGATRTGAEALPESPAHDGEDAGGQGGADVSDTGSGEIERLDVGDEPDGGGGVRLRRFGRGA